MANALIEKEIVQTGEPTVVQPSLPNGKLILLDLESGERKPLPLAFPVQTRKPYHQLAQTTLGRFLDAGVIALMVASVLAALDCFMRL